MTGIEKIRDALIEVRDCGKLEMFPVLGNKIIKTIEEIEEELMNEYAKSCAMEREALAKLEAERSTDGEKNIGQLARDTIIEIREFQENCDLEGVDFLITETDAIPILKRYAEAYTSKKCAECKDFCARARERCEDREGR